MYIHTDGSKPDFPAVLPSQMLNELTTASSEFTAEKCTQSNAHKSAMVTRYTSTVISCHKKEIHTNLCWGLGHLCIVGN